MWDHPDDPSSHLLLLVRITFTYQNPAEEDFVGLIREGNWRILPHRFLINETKSSLDPKDVSDFMEVLSNMREFFPEQAHCQIVGVIASLYVDESLLRYAERNGLIVLSFGDEGMNLRNTDGLAPRLFQQLIPFLMPSIVPSPHPTAARR